MKVLDVGCGSHKRGDVGVDKWKFNCVDYVVDLDKESLPFPDDSFDLVVCHHVVEHLECPEKVIKEMLRVSKARVKLVAPHRWGSYAHMATHKQFLNKAWFLKLGKKLGVETLVKTRFMPVVYLGVLGLGMRPHELEVEMRKT